MKLPKPGAIVVTTSMGLALLLPLLLIPSTRGSAQRTAVSLASMEQPVAGQVSQSSYDQAVLADSPTLFYPLTGTSTTVAEDASGHGNNGTIAGGVTPGVAGPLVGAASTAVQLDGKSGYIYDDTAFSSPQTYTLEMWFKTTTNEGGKLIGFGSSQTGLSGSDDRHVYMTDSGEVVFGVYPNEVVTIASPGTYNDGRWHLLDATQGPNGLALYIDGELVASAPYTSSAASYQGYWRIGYDTLHGWPEASSSYYFRGDVADVAVYPAALTPAQILAHYDAAGYSSAPAGVAIVSPTAQQTITGFGASGDWWTTDLYYFPPSAQQEVMRLLYSPTQGIGLSQYRYNIGGGGVGADVPTADESELGPTTRAPASFFVAPGIYNFNHNAGGTLFLRMAARYGASITAQVNSAPPYFKTNGLSCGGALDMTKAQAYAQYLSTVLQHLRQAYGITVDDLSPMNEPDYTRSDCTQEGMQIPPPDRATVVTDVHAALTQAGLPTKVIADESSQVGTQLLPELGQWVNQPGVAGDLAAIATHTYDFPQPPVLEAAAEAAQAHGLPIWMTEICCIVRDKAGYVTYGQGFDPSIAGGLNMADLVYKDLVYGHFSAFDWWVGASAALGCDPATSSSCAAAANTQGYNDGLVYYDPNFAIDGDYQIYQTKRLWAYGNFTRFVRPGATLHVVSGGNPALHILAFEQHDAGRPGAPGRPGGTEWDVVVIDNSPAGAAPTQVALSLPAGAIRPSGPQPVSSVAYQTSATSNLAPVAGLQPGPNGELVGEVPAQSVTTFVVRT
jgi:O-glycosyl hydrolase